MAAKGFCADEELSEVLSKLWDLDDNKCYPGVEYEIDLQGFVTSTRDTSRDFARRNLFQWVDEDKLFERETYRTFRDLLDNYEMDVAENEEVTWEERRENWAFLRAIMKTAVMKEAHRFLAAQGQAPEDEDKFMKMLHDIWFRLFCRKGGRGANSCSFEHVFVGEGREDEFIGLHNWIQFYLQEKAGNINYHGFFRRETPSRRLDKKESRATHTSQHKTKYKCWSSAKQKTRPEGVKNDTQVSINKIQDLYCRSSGEQEIICKCVATSTEQMKRKQKMKEKCKASIVYPGCKQSAHSA